jgi:putative hydrolase of the HAD superfamily
MEITFTHFGIQNQNIDPDLFFEVYSRHNHNLWGEYREKKLGKKELTQRRFRQTFDELHIVNTDPVEMNSFYLGEMPKQIHLNDGCTDILTYLKNKKYKLYIITNGFREVQHQKLESSGLSYYFKKVFISEDVKIPKPGTGIFEYAIKSSNAKKTNSLMIGDDWDTDIKGAVNFGIDAVYYNNQNRIIDNREKEKITGTVVKEIGDLSELALML